MTPLWGVIDGQPFITDATTVALDDPATIATFERLKTLHDAMGGYKSIKEFKDTWDFFGAKNQLARHQVGGMIVEQWYLNVLADESPGVDITVKPVTDKNGAPVTWAGGNAWAIPKGAKNPTAACEFAKLMTAPESWEAAAKERAAARVAEKKLFTGTFTGNTKADEAIFANVYKPAGGKFAAFDEGVKTVLEVQDNAWTVPATPVGAEFKAAWQGASAKVLLGEASAAEALKQAQTAVDAAVKKAK
jgi:multiple sugar transport system substrate-binding protein